VAVAKMSPMMSVRAGPGLLAVCAAGCLPALFVRARIVNLHAATPAICATSSRAESAISSISVVTVFDSGSSGL
jgi:hypothetical protein